MPVGDHSFVGRFELLAFRFLWVLRAEEQAMNPLPGRFFGRVNMLVLENGLPPDVKIPLVRSNLKPPGLQRLC